MARSPEGDPVQSDFERPSKSFNNQPIGSAKIEDRFRYNLAKCTAFAGASLIVTAIAIDSLSSGQLSEMIKNNSSNLLLLLFTVVSAGSAIAIIEHARRN